MSADSFTCCGSDIAENIRMLGMIFSLNAICHDGGAL